MDAMSMMDWKVVEPYPGSQASMDDMPVLEPISDVNPLSQSLTEMPELELAVMPVLEPISDVNPLSQSLTEMPTLELAVLPMEHEHPMEFAVESEDEVVPTLPTLASVISQTEVPLVIESEDEVVPTLPTLDSVISQTEVTSVIETEGEGDYSMQGPKATAMFGFEYEYPDYDADAEERVKKGSKKSFKMTDIVVVPQIVFEDRTAIVNDKFSKKWTERIRLGKVLGVVIDPGCILQTEMSDFGMEQEVRTYHESIYLPLAAKNRPEYREEKKLVVYNLLGLSKNNRWAFVHPADMRRACLSDLHNFTYHKIETRAVTWACKKKMNGDGGLYIFEPYEKHYSCKLELRFRDY